MFIATLFTIDNTQKQFRYPLTDKWIKMIQYTVEYYSPIKKNEIMPLAVT